MAARSVMARASSREATIAKVVKVEKVEDQCEIRVLGNDHKPSRSSRSEAEDEDRETVRRRYGVVVSCCPRWLLSWKRRWLVKTRACCDTGL